jgi:predicted outer membrane protein
MNTQQNATKTVNEKQLREGILPRAQLSKAACEIAVKKTTQPSVKQFAEWELMEATTVINVLKDLGTTVSSIDKDAESFLLKLKGLGEKDFNNEFMAAELSNHEFLHDLAKTYIDGVDKILSSNEGEIWHVANLALFAFTDHVGLCTKIKNELNAN